MRIRSFYVNNLQREGEEGTVPMWELRVEGRLLDELSGGVSAASGGATQNRNQPLKRKFSSFFKSLVIELDKEIYGPDNHLVEWHRTPQTNETDGFQVFFFCNCHRFLKLSRNIMERAYQF